MTQVFNSADGGSEGERLLLHGCADPLPDAAAAEQADERCVSAALALALVRAAPLSPLALNVQPREARPVAKKAKASGGAAMQAAPPARAAPKAPRSGKRKRAVPVAPLPDAPLPAAPAAPASSVRRSVPGVCSWTREEDSALLRLTQVYGERDWAGVAAALGCGRSGKQVRERYMYIKPGQKAGPWTEEDERALRKHHARLGNRWAEIARLMKRPDNMIKNRYYGRLKALKKAAELAAPVQAPVVDGGGAAL